jgi:hypothetical protein
LSHDGMAKLLGVNRESVIKMCLGGADLPTQLTDRVRILLNRHRGYDTRRPIMELVDDLLNAVVRRGGAMRLDEVVREFGLRGPHLKNVEDIDGWITLVWEPVGSTGRHAFVYLTMRGYRKLGMHMPEDAPGPSMRSKSLIYKGANGEYQLLTEELEERIGFHLQQADNLRTMQKLLTVHGAGAIETVVKAYEALAESSFEDIKAITHATKDDENET